MAETQENEEEEQERAPGACRVALTIRTLGAVEAEAATVEETKDLLAFACDKARKLHELGA